LRKLLSQLLVRRDDLQPRPLLERRRDWTCGLRRRRQLELHRVARGREHRGVLRCIQAGIAVALVEDAQRIEQDHLCVEVQVPHHIARHHRDVIDGLHLIEREVEGALRPGDEIVDGPLDLLLDRAIHRLRHDRVHRHQHLPERAPRLLFLLLRQRRLQDVAVDGARVDEQFPQPLRTRAPGVDDAAAVKADLRRQLALHQGERAGAASQVD